MSFSLGTNVCHYCTHTVELIEPPREINSDDTGDTYELHHGDIVAKAYCPICFAKYLAWLDQSFDDRDEYEVADLSFRSTFSSVPGKDDMPKYVIEVRWVKIGRYCEECGEPFETKRSDKKFCSIKCGQRARYKRAYRRIKAHRKLWKECPVCGETFRAEHQGTKYCCVEHRRVVANGNYRANREKKRSKKRKHAKTKRT